MAPVVVNTFQLPVDIYTFKEKFWLDAKWFENFLVHKLSDLSVSVGDWELASVDGVAAASAGGSGPASSTGVLQRTVRSFHPSKISFPGLPSHAESWKVQTIESSSSAVEDIVSIKEVNSFRGIPYADYFNVNTEWKVVAKTRTKEGERSESQQESKSDPENESVHVTILLDFTFHKSTWLRGTIESNTKAELVGVYELWHEHAQAYLRQRMDMRASASHFNIAAAAAAASAGDSAAAASLMVAGGTGQLDAAVASKDGAGDSDDGNIAARGSASATQSLASKSLEGSEGMRVKDANADDEDGDEEDERSYYTDEELLLFYDCEEGVGGLDGGGGAGAGSSSHGISTRRGSVVRAARTRSSSALYTITGADSSAGQGADASLGGVGGVGEGGSVGGVGLWDGRRPPTPPELHELYRQRYGTDRRTVTATAGGACVADTALLSRSGSSAENGYFGAAGGGGGGGDDDSPAAGGSPGGGSKNNRREHGDRGKTAFGVEQQQQFSARDAAITTVETTFVLSEFLYWQVHTFYTYELKELFNVAPDQVLKRLANSFLPGWHAPLLQHPDMYGPLLAVFMLPQSLLYSVETSRHGCNPTSQLGNAVIVSLFIWLGLSFLYRLLSLVVAPNMSLKQCLSVTGYSFFAWNAALLSLFPLENYKETLQLPMLLPLVLFGLPSSIALGYVFWEHTPASSITLQPAALPSSLQQFAANNNRCLQRLLWSLPKIIAFLLVAGTHYQFLWYMTRVFLPGRRQLCQLRALMQPSVYADILTQKELRKAALLLLGSKRKQG